jgi:hypothetical protein
MQVKDLSTNLLKRMSQIANCHLNFKPSLPKMVGERVNKIELWVAHVLQQIILWSNLGATTHCITLGRLLHLHSLCHFFWKMRITILSPAEKLGTISGTC